MLKISSCDLTGSTTTGCYNEGTATRLSVNNIFCAPNSKCVPIKYT